MRIPGKKPLMWTMPDAKGGCKVFAVSVFRQVDCVSLAQAREHVDVLGELLKRQQQLQRVEGVAEEGYAEDGEVEEEGEDPEPGEEEEAADAVGDEEDVVRWADQGDKEDEADAEKGNGGEEAGDDGAQDVDEEEGEMTDEDKGEMTDEEEERQEEVSDLISLKCDALQTWVAANIPRPIPLG